MKKGVIVLFLGAALIMSILSGCGEEDIQSKFSEFIDMFPSESLTYLYEKEGNIVGEDLGTWVVDSYIDYEEEGKLKGYGVVIFFNKNLKKARGNFYVYKDATEKDAYPIEYDEEGLRFIEAVSNRDVRDKFDKFKILFELISIDREYLSTLEVQKSYYNPKVPSYGIKYKLPEGDKNLNKIKNAYPEFKVNLEDVTLELQGDGDPHNMHGNQMIIVELNKEEGIYLEASYGFNESEFSDELFNVRE